MNESESCLCIKGLIKDFKLENPFTTFSLCCGYPLYQYNGCKVQNITAQKGGGGTHIHGSGYGDFDYNIS